MPRPALDLAAEDIVEAAIAVLTEQGYDAVSMRNVGARLGVSPVPLYRRVGDKDALLAAVAERLLADMAPAVAEGEPWQAYAARWAHAIHARLAATADLRVLVGNARSSYVRASQPLIDCLREAGFTPDAALQACRLLLWAVAGFAVVEPGGGAGRRRTGVSAAEAERLFGIHIGYLIDGIERDR